MASERRGAQRTVEKWTFFSALTKTNADQGDLIWEGCSVPTHTFFFPVSLRSANTATRERTNFLPLSLLSAFFLFFSSSPLRDIPREHLLFLLGPCPLLASNGVVTVQMRKHRGPIPSGANKWRAFLFFPSPTFFLPSPQECGRR